MFGLPVWFWVLVALLVVVGLRVASNARQAALVNRVPVWVCGLLVAAALVGVWLLLQAQFASLVFWV